MTRDAWMQRLATMLRPRAALTAEKLLAGYMPHLTDLPDDAFTERTALAAGAKLPRAPSLTQVRDVLERFAAPPGERQQLEPDLEHLKPAEAAAVMTWRRFVKTGWLFVDETTPERRLSSLRAHLPRAYRQIVKEDVDAADQAVRRWPADFEERDGRPQHEIDHAHQTVVRGLSALRMAADPVRSPAEQIEALMPDGPVPRHLTPLQLDQLNPLPGGRKRGVANEP